MLAVSNETWHRSLVAKTLFKIVQMKGKSDKKKRMKKKAG